MKILYITPSFLGSIAISSQKIEVLDNAYDVIEYNDYNAYRVQK